jgi:hypothetical protein
MNLLIHPVRDLSLTGETISVSMTKSNKKTGIHPVRDGEKSCSMRMIEVTAKDEIEW